MINIFIFMDYTDKNKTYRYYVLFYFLCGGFGGSI